MHGSRSRPPLPISGLGSDLSLCLSLDLRIGKQKMSENFVTLALTVWEIWPEKCQGLNINVFASYTRNRQDENMGGVATLIKYIESGNALKIAEGNG